jgi:putative protease
MPPSPEILAPAGDAACMRAAVRAGADAVYFGLQGFNARARATNFDAAELAATMRELHASGVRGYVTLNTLVFDTELATFEAAVRACAEAGVDAVIVQDLGAMRIVRAVAPELPIHASTQMTCTDAAGVELARSLGASRVILARELSLDDIAAVRRATDVEVEVFVHGALCISYSGQCMTSEAIGGRSANRGACAQACRLPYELVVDGELRDEGDRAFLLSPEDLEASTLATRLAALGVSALKIEGRMKGPEYVAATTALYRAALGERESEQPVHSSLPELRSSALQTYSRGSGTGFLQGVDHQRLVEGRSCDHRGTLVGECIGTRRADGRDLLVVRSTSAIDRGDGLLVEGGWGGEGEVGGRVWDVERARDTGELLVWLGPDKDVAGAASHRRVFKTSDPRNEHAIRATFDHGGARVAVDVRISGAIGAPFTLEATSARGHHARVVSDGPLEAARTSPTSVDVLREKLARLGQTPFELASLAVDLPAEAMVPMSRLNRARRALADALAESLHHPHAVTGVTHDALLSAALPPDRAPPPAGLFVLCRNETQAHAAIDAGADGVTLDFLELTGTGAALRSLRARDPHIHVTLAPPRIRKPGEEKIDKYLRELAPDALLVRSLGALREARDGASPRSSGGRSTPGEQVAAIGDFSLNVANRLAAAEVLACGLAAFTPSFDLDAAQLTALCATSFGPWAEVVVHHPMPLFHMEHCVIAALLSEGRDHRTCGRPCDRHRVSLRDRAGMDHPVEADVGCRNTVFHAAPQSAAGVVPLLQQSGVRRFRIELVRESREDVARVVAAYRSLLEGRTTPAELRRTLATPGGYGVVSGSLRVLAS